MVGIRQQAMTLMTKMIIIISGDDDDCLEAEVVLPPFIGRVSA